MPKTAAVTAVEDASPEQLLKGLAQELAHGELRLPSFPDVAQRVQCALEDPRATPAQVSRVIGIDAALAASTALVPCVFYRALLDETVTAVALFRRLALGAGDCQRLLAATAQQFKSLHGALSA